MKKCQECLHIYAPDEKHECPDAEYIALRDRLIAAAAQADEDGWWDEDGKHVER